MGVLLLTHGQEGTSGAGSSSLGDRPQEWTLGKRELTKEGEREEKECEPAVQDVGFESDADGTAEEAAACWMWTQPCLGASRCAAAGTKDAAVGTDEGCGCGGKEAGTEAEPAGDTRGPLGHSAEP